MKPQTQPREGKVRYALVAWLLGAPTIVVIIAAIWGGLFNW